MRPNALRDVSLPDANDTSGLTCLPYYIDADCGFRRREVYPGKVAPGVPLALHPLNECQSSNRFHLELCYKKGEAPNPR